MGETLWRFKSSLAHQQRKYYMFQPVNDLDLASQTVSLVGNIVTDHEELDIVEGLICA